MTTEPGIVSPRAFDLLIHQSTRLHINCPNVRGNNYCPNSSYFPSRPPPVHCRSGTGRVTPRIRPRSSVRSSARVRVPMQVDIVLLSNMLSTRIKHKRGHGSTHSAPRQSLLYNHSQTHKPTNSHWFILHHSLHSTRVSSRSHTLTHSLQLVHFYPRSRGRDETRLDSARQTRGDGEPMRAIA